MVTRRRVAAVAATLVACWLGLCLWSAVRLSDHADAATEALDALPRELDLGLVTASTWRGDLDRAGVELAALDRELDRWWLTPVRVLPVLGRQHRSASALAAAGRQIVEVSDQVAGEASRLLDDVDADPAGLDELLEQLAVVLEPLGRVTEGLDLGPDRALVGGLAEARAATAELVADISDSADELPDAFRALAQLSRDSDLLLLIANNAEMRVGSGMVLQIGRLEIDDGAVSIGGLGQSYSRNLDRGDIEVAPDVDALWGFQRIGREWRTLGFDPRFDRFAEMAADMYEASGGDPVDGVVLVDPVALRSLLGLIGPVSTDTQGELNETNVLFQLLVQQYVEATDDPSRRDGLVEVAEAIVDELASESLDPLAVADVLDQAAAGRHLMLWARSEPAQRAWERLGVSGELGPYDLHLGLANLAGKKFDWFIDARVDARIEWNGSQRRVELDIELINGADGTEHPALTGPFGGVGPSGWYRGAFQVAVPRSATDIELVGGERPLSSGASGEHHFELVEVELEPGETQELTVRFSLPGPDPLLSVQPSARARPLTWVIEGEERRDRLPFTLIGADVPVE